MTKCPELLQPLKVGRYTLRNRMVMAPLTRCRAEEDTHVPRTDLMLKYYEDRASAGLIVAEATMVQPNYTAFVSEPGIYSDAQVKEWKKIVDAVHGKGGLIFLQLHHGGRAGLPYKILRQKKSDKDPLAGRLLGASTLPIVGHKIPPFFSESGEKEPYGVPEELTDDEIRNGIIPLFVEGAKNAVFKAGFDGVEIHGANGYLLDGFLRDSANNRQASRYAGNTIDTRCQLIYDVTKGVCDAVGNDRVGLRISPLNSAGGTKDSDPEALTKHLCKKIEPLSLAYLHFLRGDIFEEEQGDVVPWVHDSYKGVKISNLRYSIEEANQQIKEGKVDAVAFGAKFIANPDLVERVTHNWPLAEPRKEYYYTRDAVGYNDYPKYNKQ
ncbi:prostaglandin F2alpha synthase [Trypanosoma conorhini]|uniref:Prostaglandin F2alpha synthase n=1 Tax=Trypanosoma conorhini TaxID=83891 RepID=A0A3R7RVH7_9TRYP|nr:prostaglandin F2alpha synthase [Trypanosoma conorhini]RNF13850.1 prostaglandin F2alpha synthase [Trypanosoma conorhini]